MQADSSNAYTLVPQNSRVHVVCPCLTVLDVVAPMRWWYRASDPQVDTVGSNPLTTSTGLPSLVGNGPPTLLREIRQRRHHAH